MKETTTRTPLQGNAHRASLRVNQWKRLVGPGLITGASDDDPSGIGTYSQAGAQFGTSMLWVMLFTYPLMVAVQIISAQVARVTGRGLAANLAKWMPRWLLVPLLLALFLTNALNIGADLAAMGESLTLLLPGSPSLYAVGFGVVSAGLLIFVPYSRYVALLKWLSLTLFVYAGLVVVIDIPWTTVIHDLLMPAFSFRKDYIQMLVAVLGTTISPYLFFWQSAQEVEEQRAAPGEAPLKAAPRQAERQLGRMRADTAFGMAVSNLVGLFIMLTTALTLHVHGVHDVDTAAKAASALQPVAGRMASALFAMGVIGTGLLAIPVLAGSAAYALGEAFGWRRGLERRPAAAPAFYATIALATLLGIALPLTHVNPMRALVITAVVNGVAAVPVLIAMITVARSPSVMGDMTIDTRLTWAGWITVVLMGLATFGLLL